MDRFAPPTDKMEHECCIKCGNDEDALNRHGICEGCVANKEEDRWKEAIYDSWQKKN